MVASREGKAQQTQRIKAVAFLRETQEVLRNIRNREWDNISTNGTYHTEISGAEWILQTGVSPANADGFTQQIDIGYVYRDTTTGGIVPTPTPATIDPSTKRVDVTITWNQPFTTSISSTFYLTRYLDNAQIIETSVNDFDQGTQTAVTAESPSGNNGSDDGQVLLSGGGTKEWCAPETPQVEYNLAGQGEAKGVVADEDRAFVGTGQNASGKAFYNVRVDPNVDPPQILDPVEIYDPSPSHKTNDIFGEVNDSQRFAYLATDRNDREVVILNATPNIPSLLLNVNVSGNVNGKSVYVSGDILYVTTSDNKLHTYQLSSDRTRATFQDSINLPSVGNNIFVDNGWVFIAMDSTTSQLQIINATNPSDLATAGSINVGNNQSGKDVVARSGGDRAYLVTSVSTSTNVSEIFIIDTSNKDNLSIANGGNAKYDTSANGNMDPKAISLVSGYKAIAVGYDGDPYIVFEHLNDDKLDFCGKLTVEGLKINGISSLLTSEGKTFSYIITEDSGKELQIIEGGPGGEFSSEGTYESKTYEFPLPASFNRFTATVNQPTFNTKVRLQVAVALGNQLAPYCNNANYTFIGPDPSDYTGSFFETSSTGNNLTIEGVIPFGSLIGNYVHPGRCFRYKAILTTQTSNETPYLNDMTINYSP